MKGSALEFCALAVCLICVQGLANAAQAQDGNGPTNLLWRQSVEQVIAMNVAPEPLQAFVGEEFKVAVSEGKARLIIVLQDSTTNYLNGEEVGPSHDIHFFLRIEGPREGTLIPVVGAATTFPTLSWYYLFGGTSHPQVLSKFAASGFRLEPIQKLSLIHSSPNIRGGVTIDGDRGFSWTANAKAPEFDLLGVNHDLYTRDETDKVVHTQVQALVNVQSWAGAGILEVAGDVLPGGLFPAGTYPVTVNHYDPIWIRASLNVPVPEKKE